MRENLDLKRYVANLSSGNFAVWYQDINGRRISRYDEIEKLQFKVYALIPDATTEEGRRRSDGRQCATLFGRQTLKCFRQNNSQKRNKHAVVILMTA